MNSSRPKLTRRRGACEGCRQKKVRCDGGRPCSYCERIGSPCEYIPVRGARQVDQQGVDVRLTPESHPSSDYVGRNDAAHFDITQSLSYSLDSATTSTLDEFLSQLSPDHTITFDDFDFPFGYAAASSRSEDLDEESHTNTPQDEILLDRQGNGFMTFDSLSWNADGRNLLQDWTTWTTSSLESRRGSCSSESILGLFPTQVVAENREENIYTGPKKPAVAIPLQQAIFRNRRQQVVVEKVEKLLSPDYQLSVSSLLSDTGPGRDYHSLNLASLPMDSLIQRAFQEPAGLNMFIRPALVRNIYSNLQSPSKPAIHVEDVSMLITTLAWGALLDPSMDFRTRAVLIDAACDALKALFLQRNTIRKFLALVATLALVEVTGSDIMYTLVVQSASTAAALGLHLQPSILDRCINDDEVIQVQCAMWMLYCVEKSFALRVQTFSILGDDFLPTTTPPKSAAREVIAPIPSVDWLEIRSKYARICSNILQLRGSLKGNASRDHSGAMLALAAALKEWYTLTNTNPVISSSSDEAVKRIKLQLFNRYHEALLHLGSLSLPLDQTLPAWSEKSKQIRGESIREVITSSNTISSESLLQDVNHAYVNKLAVCLLAIEIIQSLDTGCGKDEHALLSVACGFFARIRILLPGSPLFEDISRLVEILAHD